MYVLDQKCFLKNRPVYPCKPQFIKVGYEVGVVNIARTCFLMLQYFYKCFKLDFYPVHSCCGLSFQSTSFHSCRDEEKICFIIL